MKGMKCEELWLTIEKEFMWQYIFTGMHSVCPPVHLCYCDAYGLCFGSADVGGASQGAKGYAELMKTQKQLKEVKEKASSGDKSEDWLLVQSRLRQEYDGRLMAASTRGKKAWYRAEEAGREFKGEGI
jgi:hypothetical protein